jgi:AraC-like DNA-binding protein
MKPARPSPPAPPDAAAVHPPAFDALFQALRVKGVMYFAHEFGAPWAMRFSATGYARFHIILKGRCWMRIDGRTVALKTNDLLFFPAPPDHVLGDGDEARSALAPDARDIGAMIRAGTLRMEGGARTRLISGHFEFDPQVRGLLLDSLPDIIKARARTSANRSLVLALPALMASELRERRPGGAVIVERLAEILLVQVLRDHFEERRTCVHAERPSLMAALFDPRLGAALHFMYAESANPLTLARIAAAAGMSRSAFAQRFKALTGEMPMAHLAEWRLLRATRLLADRTLSIAQVAAACGHRSTEGFSRAFKRRHGASPARWREARDMAAA